MAENINIPDLPDYDPQRAIHLYRYKLATRFATGSIIDAACGWGYGSHILSQKGTVTGYDRDTRALTYAREQYPDLTFIEADLDSIELPEADTAVSFETIEHLQDPERFAAQLAKSKTVILSTPIIPTKHFNPFHLHDFTADQVKAWFNKQLIHEEYQDEGGTPVYGIFVFA